MGFQDQVIKFKTIELSKTKHRFDNAILIDIRPLAFSSVQKKPLSEIKYSEVYIKGVAEKVFDILLWNIPEITKASKDFKKLFIDSFCFASSSKWIALGDYSFYPNFSELAYELYVQEKVKQKLNLTPIDKMICKQIIGNIPKIIHSKCIEKFGHDYGERSLADFANEYPRLNEEIGKEFKSKNKKAS